MIFVTVGTHEQPFNRLIKKIDELVRDGKIKDEVFMQIGYSTYIPKYVKWQKVIGYEQMNDFINNSDVVITHGGPSTYMKVLQIGKRPIVVPRQKNFDEHINDHQIFVSNQVKKKGYPLIICEDIEKILTDILMLKESQIVVNNVSHNSEFIRQFNIEIKKLFNKNGES